MRRVTAALLACATAVGLVGSSVFATIVPAHAATTGNTAAQAGRIVSPKPAANTPNVMDGAVLTLAKVGKWIVVGGTFTTVRNPGSSTDIARKNVFAFDATTGQVSTSFAPNPNASVYKVLPSADGGLYVGGDFTQITSGGKATTVSRLVKLAIATGDRDARFNPGTLDRVVRDLELTGNRLWVAGKFSSVHGKQRALGTLNAATGAYDPFFNGVFAGVHNPSITNATTSVLSLTTDPSNGQLVAGGNFLTVNGAARRQIVKLGITGTKYTLAPWYTKMFESACSRGFESYVSDVSFSPNGKYFVVATTGAYGGSAASYASTSGCDVVARFEAGVTGVRTPTWANYTGGDTTWTVEVTDDVIYAGGHQKFQNNPGGNNVAGPGAVARTGIAALNPVNGLPYSWNPTRTRGVGIKDMLATEDGLYVGSDTNTFAGLPRYKVAFLPLSGGKTLPTQQPNTVPGEVFRVRTGESKISRAAFSSSGILADPSGVGGGPDWSEVVGAFMVNGTLYTAYGDGRFTKRTFDGNLYGYETAVDAADRAVRQATWHDTDVPSITSLWYSGGRLYYTRAGESLLYSRAFEPESDVVGELRYTSASVSGVNFATMRGGFVADGKLYFGSTNGTLGVATWSGTAPVAGTGKTLLSAGLRWSSRVMFLYNGTGLAPANEAPSARAAYSCDALDCTFDASESRDDGEVTSYAWRFGDGDDGEGVSAQHRYAAGGVRTATLTVTDDDGDVAQTTVSVDVPEPAAKQAAAPKASEASEAAEPEASEPATSESSAASEAGATKSGPTTPAPSPTSN